MVRLAFAAKNACWTRCHRSDSRHRYEVWENWDKIAGYVERVAKAVGALKTADFSGLAGVGKEAARFLGGTEGRDRHPILGDGVLGWLYDNAIGSANAAPKEKLGGYIDGLSQATQNVSSASIEKMRLMIESNIKVEAPPAINIRLDGTLSADGRGTISGSGSLPLSATAPRGRTMARRRRRRYRGNRCQRPAALTLSRPLLVGG